MLNKWLTTTLCFTIGSLAGPLYAQNYQEDDEFEDVQEEFLISDTASDETSNENTITDSTAPSPSSTRKYPSKMNQVFAADPIASNGMHITVFGEYFYGMSHASNLHYSNLISNTPATATPIENFSPLKAKIKDIQNKWDSGYRLGLGYAFGAQGWDITASAFFFTNDAESTERPPSSNDWILDVAYATPFNNLYPDNLPLTKQTGHWHFGITQLDLTMGKEFFISPYYSIKPKGGIRQIWLREKLQARSYNDSPQQIAMTFHNSNHFTGFGLKGGFENRFRFLKMLDLMIDTEASLNYGPNSIRSSAISTIPTIIVAGNSALNEYFSGTGTEVSQSAREIIPVIDIGVSLGWSDEFYKQKLGFSAKIGYEFHALINGFTVLEELIQGTNVQRSVRYQTTNVAYQGLTITGSVSF